MKDIDVYCDNIIAAAECLKNYTSLTRLNENDRILNIYLVRSIGLNKDILAEFFKKKPDEQRSKESVIIEKNFSPEPVDQSKQPAKGSDVIASSNPDTKIQSGSSVNPAEESHKILHHFDKILNPAVVLELKEVSEKFECKDTQSFINAINCRLKEGFSSKSENYISIIEYLNKNNDYKYLSKYFEKNLDLDNNISKYSILYFLNFYFTGLMKIDSNTNDKRGFDHLNLVIQLSYLCVVLIVNSFKNSSNGMATGHTDVSLMLNSPGCQAHHLRLLQKFVVEKFVSEFKSFKMIQLPSYVPITVTTSTFLDNQKKVGYDKDFFKFIPNPDWVEVENYSSYNISNFLNVGLTDITRTPNKVKFPLFVIIEKRT